MRYNASIKIDHCGGNGSPVRIERRMKWKKTTVKIFWKWEKTHIIHTHTRILQVKRVENKVRLIARSLCVCAFNNVLWLGFTKQTSHYHVLPSSVYTENGLFSMFFFSIHSICVISFNFWAQFPSTFLLYLLGVADVSSIKIVF